jgi:hypothetical protein
MRNALDSSSQWTCLWGRKTGNTRIARVFERFLDMNNSMLGFLTMSVL